MWRVLSLCPKGMEFTRKFIQIEGNSMRLVGHCGGLNEARVESNAPHKGKFCSVIESRQRSLRQRPPAVALGRGQIRDDLTGIAKYRLSAGVAILNIEYRVVAGLLDHIGEVEVE